MKKLGAIFTLVALLVTLSTSICFAADHLAIEETFPKDGSTGASIDNLGVKIRFNQDLSQETVGEANKDAFQLYDSKGKKLPTRILYNERKKGEVLVLIDNTTKKEVKIEGNTEYTLKIAGDLVDDHGNALGKDTEIKFTTLNQNTNTMVSMGMMVLMFGGMLLISSRSKRKEAQEDKKEEKVNPYKKAKETGKSVEEIIEKENKKKARKQSKPADDEDEYEEDDDDEINKYKVAGRRPASAVSSKYVAAKKAASKKAKAQGSKKKTASKGKKEKK